MQRRQRRMMTCFEDPFPNREGRQSLRPSLRRSFLLIQMTSANVCLMLVLDDGVCLHGERKKHLTDQKKIFFF